MPTKLKPETLSQQQMLAHYCRTNKQPELIGTTPGRLSNYRRLVFNVVKDALSNSYPLTENMLTSKEWENLCFQFFSEHKCLDPQVWKMPFELIAFAETSCPDLTKKYPWLLELLLFEWKEVEYYMMPDKDFPVEKSGDFWSEPWSLNPEMEIMRLSYPLHLKNARFISRTDKGDYFCLIYRQPQSYKVKFLNISPFFAWIIETMRLEPSSLIDLAPVIESQFGVKDEASLKGNIEPFFEKLLDEGVIV